MTPSHQAKYVTVTVCVFVSVWFSVDDDEDEQQRDVPGGINRKAKMDKQVPPSPHL